MTQKIPDSFGAMMESKFLKKEDIADPDEGEILTIEGFRNENVAPDNQEPEHKWIVTFEEVKKGMVLNSTVTQALRDIFGSPRESVGQRVCVYVDQNVTYAGRRVGGLRIRAASKRSREPRQPSMDDINRDLARAADDAPPF